MLKNRIIVFSFIILLLLIVPICFAEDNDTAVLTENDGDNVELESTSNPTPLGVDYYFNSSSETDGDGSIENPYNKINSDRIKAGSTIHLADGEYTLAIDKVMNNVEILGQNPEKTIIRYSGTADSGRFTLNSNNYLILKNVTLIGFNIDIEGGTLQANNAIIKNAVAFTTYSSATDLVNSASNSFGGAIYAYSYQTYTDKIVPIVLLDNCTFINNTAEYGGAIFMNEGTLHIVNSTFINNTAYNFGGAISAVYAVSSRIEDTKFINDNSINDAGGALYLYKSTLSAFNMSVINCSATFGAAITSLNSTTALSRFTAINNTAKYEGGAIYHIYNGISIINSTFTNNSARNGGAVYADDVMIFTLNYNTFNYNRASDTAGAVYLMFMPGIVENKTNTYTENKANIYNDFYLRENLFLTIGNGNYTLLINDYDFDGNLPDYFDLREHNLVTPVKDQQSGGNCWAFGSIAALESAILKASGDVFDLSEENMKNLMQIYSDYGWSEIETNDGGYDEMAIGYLTSWLGPVSESIEEYDDYSMLSPVLKSLFHIQNIIFLGRNSYTDNNAIKEAIIKYGAVSTGIYFDSSYLSYLKKSYYYYGSNSANHAVAIVGWDDNYSSSNFNYKPAGNGAWIVKNSWNSNWGDDGYFYVSYYDTRLAQVGISDYSYAFVFNDTARYDKNYQYDIIGKTDYMVTGEKSVWVENIFNSTDNELLAAVSTYFRKTTDWELFIYLNDELVMSKNGTSTPGYWTIDLGEYIPIGVGDIFRVMFKLTSDSGAEFGISEKVRANKLSYKPGISFFSLDGVNWTDLYNYTAETEEDDGHYYNSQVASIKAFTILYELKPTIQLDVTNVYNKAEITAVIYDQYNNLIRSGEVIFNIEGKNYTVKIENSKANMAYIFQNKGTYDIKASYFNAKENFTLKIMKLDVDLDIDINKDKNNVSIAFNSLLNVDAILNVSINNKNYTLDLKNGKASLDMFDLDFGYYEISASVIDNDYAGDLNSNFNITIIKTLIMADDLITYYGLKNAYSIHLIDVSGNPVIKHKVSFIVDGKSYVSTTDENGIANLTVKFDQVNTYKMSIMFFEDANYFGTSATSNINVKSTIEFLDTDTHLQNSNINIKLFDQNGNAAYRSQVNLVINGVDYWLITDNDGMISQKINLNPGKYSVIVNNLETGEISSKMINIIFPLQENKDMTVFYGSNTYYQVRVYGEGGNPVSAGKTVQMIVDKKTYNVKTDSNGYAKLKITFAPKTYTITSTYSGYKVSNKIVVKSLLSAKNIVKKKSKTIKFSAKLINSNGKAVKGKKLTFKIKGKKYTAKTNKKGIAKISIKNLKVGKYKITTRYSKLSIKNTIKIKK